MVESEPYHVDKLDLERKKAYVRKVDVDYYTDAMTYTNVRVIDGFEKRRDGNVIVEHGEVTEVWFVSGSGYWDRKLEPDEYTVEYPVARPEHCEVGNQTPHSAV